MLPILGTELLARTIGRIHWGNDYEGLSLHYSLVQEEVNRAQQRSLKPEICGLFSPLFP